MITWRRGISEGGGECAFLSAIVSSPIGSTREFPSSMDPKLTRDGSTDNTPINSTMLVTLNESKSLYT